MAVTTRSQVTIEITEAVTTGLGPLSYKPAYTKKDALASGTGAGQCDLEYYERVTLGAGASRTLDLTALTNGAGIAINFARVREFHLFNLSTTDGDNLVLGAAASNPWTGAFTGLTCLPGSTDAPGHVSAGGNRTTGYPVSGTSKSLKISNPGLNSVSYDLFMAGASA